MAELQLKHRLSAQKLMTHLVRQGKDINNISGEERPRSRNPDGLDIVRVTGNNAVRPGELVEDTDAAVALLQLINLVVERKIATQKRIEEMFCICCRARWRRLKKRNKPKG
jgi:hypothetical protein